VKNAGRPQSSRPLSIGGNYPWWSLGIFFLCVYIVHGIFIYGEDERAPAS
jgi:hypothetical protein